MYLDFEFYHPDHPRCFIGKEELTEDEIGIGWDCCQDCINERLERINQEEHYEIPYRSEWE